MAVSKDSTKRSRKVITSLPTASFFNNSLDFILRLILTIDILKKLVVYCLVVFFVSLLTDIQRPMKSYFSDKNNALNQYFVKLGWGWTLSAVLVLVLLTKIIEHKELRNLSSAIIRLSLATAYWYICANGFVWIDGATSSCTNPKAVTKSSCIEEGHTWIGFDISGHCFLLAFCSSVINEESQVLHQVSKRIDSIERNNTSSSKETSISYRILIRLIMVCLVFLTIIWEVMLFSTSLYFHTTVQKMLGLLFAIVGWFVIYRVKSL